MKKGIITLCMVVIGVFLMANAAFAGTAEDAATGKEQISSETEQFLYGDWKVKTFLGFRAITKGDIEYSGGEKIFGKIITIAPNLFFTRDFAPEYEKYAVKIWTDQYNVIDSITGEEFISKYKVSEDVTKIKGGDKVQVIQAVSEDKNDASVEPLLVDVNNERLLICFNGNYFELGKNFWSQNDMDVAIFDPDASEDGFYHVEYHNNEAELVPEDDHIRLLMINGGLVPYPDIKVVNDHMLVPLKVVSELLGAKVDWDEKSKTIVITEDGTKICLTIDSTAASINGNIKTLDAPPVMLDGKTYVPIRFVAEALSADVGYVSSLGVGSTQRFGEGAKKTVSTVSVVTIEKLDKDAKSYSIEEGLVKVKEASEEEYRHLLNYLKHYALHDDFEDYDAQDIVYTNQTYGRYYVYRLAAFSGFNIFFNKYTGEIYSEDDGLPFLFIDKGFINISWLYQ